MHFGHNNPRNTYFPNNQELESITRKIETLIEVHETLQLIQFERKLHFLGAMFNEIHTYHKSGHFLTLCDVRRY